MPNLDATAIPSASKTTKRLTAPRLARREDPAFTKLIKSLSKEGDYEPIRVETEGDAEVWDLSPELSATVRVFGRIKHRSPAYILTVSLRQALRKWGVR